MLHLTPSRPNANRPHSHHTRLPFTRRLKLEPLEDRRMLSATLFVDADAAPGGNGLAWESAFEDLQDALDQAEVLNTDGDLGNDVASIWVAEGVYRPSAELEPGDARSASFSLVDGVTLYGGFAGSETELAQRDWVGNETVLSGDLGVVGDVADNAYTVVYCGEGVGAALDGVTITGGNGDGSYVSSHKERQKGGGVYCAGTLDVRNAIIESNAAEDGGGIYNYRGTLGILDSIITDNSASQDGGGIYTDHGTLGIHRSTISRNETGGTNGKDGGGLFCSHTPVEATDSAFVENSAGNGGAVYTTYSSSFSLTNSVFLGNAASRYGGGVYAGSDSEIGLIGSVVAGNVADDGGGVYSTGGTLNVVHSTLTGNLADSGGGVYETLGSFSLVNSIVSLNTGGDLLGRLAEGSANNFIGLDPKFARNPWTNGTDDYGDLRLTDQSAGIDGGDTSRLPNDAHDLDQDDDTDEPLPLDVDGAARVYGSAVDIGAYEYQADPAAGRETMLTLVTTTTDSFDLYDGEISLREAVWYAKRDSVNSPITFARSLSGSTIELSGSSIVIDEGVTIDASALADGLVIDGAGASRVFTILALEGQSVDLVGVSVSNGHAHDGGGLYLASASLGLTNSTISGNSAYYGAGIYNAAGNLSLVNSTVAGNAAQSSGGGIYCQSGAASLTSVTVAGNSAMSGGGVYGASEPITLINAIVAKNGKSDLFGTLSAGSTNNLIAVDPQFVRNPGTNGRDDPGDLHLNAHSAAIDAGLADRILADVFDLDQDGDSDEPLPVDVDGNTRVYGDSVDVGACEFHDAPAAGRETRSAVVTAANDLFDLYDGTVSLREALYHVGTGSLGTTVTFSPELSGATIVLGGSSLLLHDGVMIDASGLPEGITIDGDDRSRVFSVIAPADDSVELAGLTITGGSAAEGAAILNKGGTLKVTNSTLTQNRAQSEGGAIGNDAGTLRLVSSVVSWNSANAGGGIFNHESGVLHVEASTLSNNTAESWGGGIYNNRGTLNVANSTLCENSANASGGAIADHRGTVNVAASTLSGNLAQSRGAGIYAEYSILDIANSTLSGNSALEGGGVYGDRFTLRVTNSTLTENAAQSRGGGVGTGYDLVQVTLENSVIAANVAGTDPDIPWILCGSGRFSCSNSLIGQISGQTSLVDGENGNLVGTPEIPIDPMLEPLADNGGPTFTHALLDGSPAVDAGDDSCVRGSTDQRGRARLYGTVDMGAFELQPDGFAAPVSDGFDLIVGEPVTFDPAANDFVPEGYTATAVVTQTVAHGELTSNPNGTYTYVPDEGFVGEDFLHYALDTGIGVNSGESIVVFNVLPEDCLLVDTAEDVVDGDLSLGDVSLREALQAATTGETIYFSTALMNRSIVLAQGEFVLCKNVTLDGLRMSPVTIDAAGSGTVFHVPDGIVATMDGLRITGGAGNGGGIYNSGTLTIRHSLIEQNTSFGGPGGGVLNDSAVLNVIDSMFSNNTGGMGGGIFNTQGVVSVTDSRFVGNSATGSGGAIANNGGNVTVTATTFSENSTQADGGGLFTGLNGTLTITHSTVSDNEARSRGGGIFRDGGTVRVVNSTLSGNSAIEGGGIYVDQVGRLEVANSTLTGNSASQRGGGIATGDSQVYASANNTIIACNSADHAPDVYLYSSWAGGLSGSNNIIGDGYGQSSLTDGVYGNLVGTAKDPIDPILGPLADNGGPTLTHSPLAGSPAIDAGNDALVVDLADQRGRARLFGTVDIGAVEIQPAGFAAPVPDGFDVTVDTSVTFDPCANDLVPNGYTASIQPLSDVEHGALMTNPDGTFTYVPHDSFTGEDGFRYRIDTGVGILSEETIVVFNVVPSGALLVDTADDVVNGNVSAGDLCLREALTVAASGETIYVSASLVNQTISLQLGELVLGKGVVIDGLQNDPITIDAGENSRAFRVASGVDATIDGMRIIGGYFKGFGGAILNDGSLTVRYSTIEGNTAEAGGGIFNQNGTLIVLNSAIDGNRAYDSHGGGIYNQAGTVSVVNSTLSKNWADSRGGAVFSAGGELEVTNSVLIGNRAGFLGAALYNSEGTIHMTNSTVVANTAGQFAGGIFSSGNLSRINLLNAIVARNTAPYVSDIHIQPDTLTGSHTLIGDGAGPDSLVDGQNGNLVGTTETPKDPGFVRNPSDGGDGFGDNPSTPGLDESANDDYGDLRLRANSPAVDAGDDSLLPPDRTDLDADGDTAEPIPYDIAGNPRVSGERVDMGAYEFFAVALIPGDLDGDGFVGGTDLDIIRANWGQAVPVGSLYDGDPSGDGMVGGPDLDIVRANWGQSVPAAGVETSDVPGESGDLSQQEPVVGPRRERDQERERAQSRDAFFANTRALADAAWMEAVESLSARRERRQTAAVDAAFLAWEGGN